MKRKDLLIVERLSGKTLDYASSMAAMITLLGAISMMATLVCGAALSFRPTTPFFYSGVASAALFAVGITMLCVPVYLLNARVKHACKNLGPGQLIVASVTSLEQGLSAAAEVERFMALKPLVERLATCVYLEGCRSLLVTVLPDYRYPSAAFAQTLQWFCGHVTSTTGPGLHVHYARPTNAELLL
jgi:hypothetical protein